MRFWLNLGLALVLFGYASCGVGRPLQTLGYVSWWMQQQWQMVPIQRFDRLFFFELKVSSDGLVAERHGWPEQWQALQEATQAHQVPLDLTLSLFDEDTFNPLFLSQPGIHNLLATCLQLAQSPAVSGLHIDFEVYTQADPQAIASYRVFLRQLADALHQLSPARTLSVFLPANAKPSIYDAAALRQVDWVVAQSYDAHDASSKFAGPVAPLAGKDGLTWESAVAKALKLGVSRERLILSFPLYGYEWIVKNNRPRSAALSQGSITTFAPVSQELLPDIRIDVRQRVRQYGAVHDSLSGSSYYQFKNQKGQWVQGWFEDWWSLGFKMEFLKKEHLAGMAYFVLGYDQGDLVAYYLHNICPDNSNHPVDQELPTQRIHAQVDCK